MEFPPNRDALIHEVIEMKVAKETEIMNLEDQLLLDSMELPAAHSND